MYGARVNAAPYPNPQYLAQKRQQAHGPHSGHNPYQNPSPGYNPQMGPGMTPPQVIIFFLLCII
jgi:hypothetical protein